MLVHMQADNKRETHLLVTNLPTFAICYVDHATCAAAIFKVQGLQMVAGGVQSRQASLMVVGVQAWGCIARLLGHHILMSSRQILNPLLKVLARISTACALGNWSEVATHVSMQMPYKHCLVVFLVSFAYVKLHIQCPAVLQSKLPPLSATDSKLLVLHTDDGGSPIGSGHR